MKDKATLTDLARDIILLVAMVSWKGYVLSVLWVWFIVAAFGVPAISIPVAIGISIIVNFIMPTRVETTNDIKLGWSGAVVQGFVTPLAVLALAWIVKGFI